MEILFSYAIYSLRSAMSIKRKYILIGSLVMLISACGGSESTGGDPEPSQAETAESGANGGESVAGDESEGSEQTSELSSMKEFRGIDFDDIVGCIFVGENSSNRVIAKGRDAQLKAVKVNVTGLSALQNMDESVVQLVSHTDDSLSVYGLRQGITAIEAKFRGKRDSWPIGVFDSNIEVPVVLKKKISSGCHYVLATSKSHNSLSGCGSLRSSGLISVDGYAIRAKRCELENPQNIPVIDVE